MPYESITIVQPLNDETVHENAGSVHVVMRLRPALRDGDGIEILIDGKTVSRRASTSIDVEGVERGTHELRARIVAQGGEVLVSSPPVTFHMWQASRLFRDRQR